MGRSRRLCCTICLVMACGFISQARVPLKPEAAAATLEAAAARHSWIELSGIGHSPQGRPIVAVHLQRGHDDVSSATDPWTVLLIGQQHGDEPAGMEALVALVDGISLEPDRLEPGVSLWVVPIANPDGAATATRRNGADADLNRDHIRLEQPETRALHELARAVQAHVVVDCHEFRRDSGDYLQRGWTEWPLITMDSANHPLLPDTVYTTGLKWIRLAEERLSEHGFQFQRYIVGDAPPDGERRPSTLDGDDARNGLALTGSLGFIIESGMHRTAIDPNTDLDRRVAAYSALLELFLTEQTLRDESRAAVAAMRTAPTPETIPTNVFWGAVESSLQPFPVVSKATGTTQYVPTQVMDTRVFKGSVPAPLAYAVLPSPNDLYQKLLKRHQLELEVLVEPRDVIAERCILQRVETEHDPIYHRYGGRQVVQRQAPARTLLPVGTLLVPVNQPQAARVMTILEPCQLFGLYQYDQFLDTVTADGDIPVLRIVAIDITEAANETH